ncbi:MAG: hypothetical protein KCHDKBKB_01927 [Elusimicrobia bacterium]|nr:hypothetical protein [Elusimicrobiota bacterium]
MAETFTDKLKLTKRDTGDLNWGQGHNANLDLVDAHAQQGLLRPPRMLLATLGSGGVGAELLGNTIYFYKVTAINAAGETTENKIPATLEAQVSQPVTPLPVILQWETVKGSTGYRIYKSTLTGQEKYLVEVTGESMINYTDTGNVATNNLISVPADNTARTSVRKIVAGSGISVTPPDGTGDVTIQASGTSGVASIKKTGEVGGLAGDVELEQGVGMQLTQDGLNNRIKLDNSGVTGLRKLGEVAPLVGDVKMEAGANITLTQDAPNNKITIAAAGGGGGQTVASAVLTPTGVAATDTSNLTTAITNVSGAGGGKIILRAGVFAINNKIDLPANVEIEGEGPATVIRGTSPMTGFSGRYVLIVPSGGKLSRLKLDISQITDTAFMRQAMWLLGSPVRLVEVEIECGNVGSGIDMGSGPIFLEACRINCGTGGQAFVTVGQDIHVSDSDITAIQLANNSGGTKRFHNCRLALGSVSLNSVELINCRISDLDTSSSHLITLASGIIRDSVITTHIFNFSKNALLITGQTIAVNNRLSTTNPGIFQTTINIQGSKNTVHGNYVHSNINLNSGAVDNIVKNNFASVTDSSGQSNTIADNRTAV